MAQLAGYRPNIAELLKSKLSPKDEDYTFWLSKQTKKKKPVIKRKGSITALKDFFRKKFGCKGQWSYVEAGRNRPATWRLKEINSVVIWYRSTTTLCFQGEKADQIKELVLSTLGPLGLDPPRNNKSSNLWNSSDTDPLPFFPDTPDKFENSVADWTCCDNTAVEALLQLQTSETSWKPTRISRAYAQEMIQADEPADESETNSKNPEGVDLNCMRNFWNQNERNTDFDRVSMLLDFLCEENIKCKKLTECNSILEEEVQDLKAEPDSNFSTKRKSFN